MHYNFGSLAAASILLALLPGSAFGLVIYRWGGETLSPPSQSGSEGVDFVQLAWTDVAEEGQVFQLDMDESIIRPLSFGPEDNIAPLALEKGGVFRHEDYHTVFDGDLNTVFVSEEYQCSEKRGGVSCDGDYGSKGTIQIHLKGFFALDRIRIASGVDDPVHTARNIRVHVTDNPPDLPFWLPGPFRPVIVEVRDNREQFLDVDISSHGKVAFVQVALSQHTVTWDVHDIEIYARGFVDKSTYISNIVDFGRPMAWGELRWGGRRDPNAQVFIQKAELEASPDDFVLPHEIDEIGRIRAQGRLHIIDGDFELAPGLKIYLIPGHTLGQMAMTVNTDDGQVTLSGDTIYTYENLEYGIPGAIGVAPEVQLRGQERLKQIMGASTLLLVPMHDLEVYERFPQVADRLVEIALE